MIDTIKNSHDEEGIAYSLNAESFEFLRGVALAYAGIDIPKRKKKMVYNHLLPRIKALNLPSFESYCHLISSEKEEEEKFVNLITNSLTTFFREYHHFEFLSRYLREILDKKSTLRIWSAGCATGEEPYSIAMIVNEIMHEKKNVTVSILATDINTDSLAYADKGIYVIDKIRHMDVKHIKQFYRGIGQNTGFIKVKNEIRKLVSFRQHNLNDNMDVNEPFDIIFCRNVIIYFPEKIARSVVDKLDKLLVPGGILILGHSESLHQLRHRYEMLDNTIYRKMDVVKEGDMP